MTAPLKISGWRTLIVCGGRTAHNARCGGRAQDTAFARQPTDALVRLDHENLSFACLVITLVSLAGCGGRKATPEEARKFIDDAEQKLLALGIDAGRADWVKATYITDDTEALAAKVDERAIAATVDYAKQATRFDGLQLDPVDRPARSSC